MAFSLFKKRKSDEVRIKLEADQFCSVIEEKQDDVTDAELKELEKLEKQEGRSKLDDN